MRELARALRRAARELQVRRPRALRPGLRRPEEASIRGLIYCSVTGFGQTGPYRERPGYDFMIQGMGGHDERHRRARRRARRRAADGRRPDRRHHHRHVRDRSRSAPRSRTAREPARASTSISRCSIRRSRCSPTRTRTTSPPARRPSGSATLHPNIVPYQPFKHRDGDVILACGNDNLFRKFCEVGRLPELADDPRFATNGKRVENRAELTRLLQEIFAEENHRANGSSARSAPACRTGRSTTSNRCSPSRRCKARGMRIELPASERRARCRWSRARCASRKRRCEHDVPPPTLGQHTDEVLRTC